MLALQLEITRIHRPIGALVLASALTLTAGASAQTKTWTMDADFDAGVLDHVNHSVTHDQLQLDSFSQSFSFLWIANSSRGTLVRVDAQTGAVLGEYRTAPGTRARNPSRTTIDRFGNVWTGNRSEAANGQGSVVKVGLVLGGTRVSKLPGGGIMADPQGLYLAPPFLACTAVDRDRDGLIRTSRGLGDIQLWPDVTDGQGGVVGTVEDAVDECILIYQRTSVPSINQVSLDADGNLWAGSYPAGSFEVLDGGSGGRLRSVTPGFGAFGGCIDRGVLWSSSPNQNAVLRYDIATGTALRITVTQATGMACDANGAIWNSMGTNNTIAKLDFQGTMAAGFPTPSFGGNSFGIGVTSDGDVWCANSSTNTVTRLANGTSLRKRLTISGSPNGLTVDAAGKVWVTCQLNSTLVRIDPHGGTDGLGATDLVVTLGSGAGPQTFAGMATQVVVTILEPRGTWNVVHDGARDGAPWNQVDWHSTEPAGTRLRFEARAADRSTDLPARAWLSIANGADLRGSGLRGRFIELRATFERGTATVSPVLHDVTLLANEVPDVTQAAPSVEKIWPPKHNLIPVEILGVSDPDGDVVTISVLQITQDEPVRTHGVYEEPDADGIGTAVAQVRGERDGNGNGRVYEIQFEADDGRGGIATGSVTVCVPHDMGRGSECIDDGQLYSSIGSSVQGKGGLEAQLYPNPFNPTTTLSYLLPSPGTVRIAIFDVGGRQIWQQASGNQSAGEHAVRWDGRNTQGAVMPSGVYVYRVVSGELESTGRMLLVK